MELWTNLSYYKNESSRNLVISHFTESQLQIYALFKYKSSFFTILKLIERAFILEYGSVCFLCTNK